MKRYILLILVTLLLLLSEAVTLFAAHADHFRAPAQSARSARPIQIDRLEFYYKLDGKARFLDLKTRWQETHHGETSFRTAAILARQADAMAKTEAPLTLWRYHGGPDPAIFSGKMHIHNQGTKALLNVPVKTTLLARVGPLSVKPDTLLTDFDALERSARWQVLSSQTFTIPAIAPDEDMLIPAMAFRLYDFMSANPNRWPVEVAIRVGDSPLVASASRSVRMIPDHFVMPVLY